MGALWTGVSGLLSYSQGIAVTANNLANTNTTGFKSSRILFEDMLSSMAGSTSDGSQIGTGSMVGSVSLLTGSGGLESTSISTDMAIDGDDGYFVVKNPVDGNTYYTRAGDFSYDNAGNLITSTGCNVQGWAVDQAAVAAAKLNNTTLSQVPTTGALTNIKIDATTMAGQATSSASVVANLDSDTEIGTKDATDPYFTMFKSYNANSDPPVSDSSYSSTIKVYDSEGGSHTLTTYYSKVSDEGGKEYWEYTVAMDPSEDGNATTSGTTKAGVLMIGTMTFSSSGTLENETAYTLTGSDPTSLSSWTQATLDSSGVPEMNATFQSKTTSGTVLPAQTIDYKNGLSTSGTSWNSGSAATAAGIGSNASATAGFNTALTKNASSCTSNYATSSYTVTTAQNGYGTGSLLSTSVDNDGVISGAYSNGQTKALYVVALADFINPTDLTQVGNSLFAANAETGAATIGRANTGKFDGISGYTLEASNVEMATEMVSLITNQRAFESNSKVVTTADAMMEVALGLKK
jgi:flagellar hook protein FlgE